MVHLSEEAKDWLVYIIGTLSVSGASFLTTTGGTSSSSPPVQPTSSHTVMAALTVPNIYASPSSVQKLALASHEDPVVPLESAPAVVAALGGDGDNARVEEPAAKKAKVMI